KDQVPSAEQEQQLQAETTAETNPVNELQATELNVEETVMVKEEAVLTEESPLPPTHPEPLHETEAEHEGPLPEAEEHHEELEPEALENFSGYNKEELAKRMEELSDIADLNSIKNKVNQARDAFNHIVSTERS